MLEIEKKPDETAPLTDNLRVIDAKLAKLTDVIEAVRNSETLAERLARLEQEAAVTEKALKEVPTPARFLPEAVLPALLNTWRELALSIESPGDNAHATRRDIEAARTNLMALLGNVMLRPTNGIL